MPTVATSSKPSRATSARTMGRSLSRSSGWACSPKKHRGSPSARYWKTYPSSCRSGSPATSAILWCAQCAPPSSRKVSSKHEEDVFCPLRYHLC
ncbi:TPA: hypothetical protein N0F65_009682 [Lagenidium giganteum]|uniref:Uncharacterized protein n=1 Tax=Lagenidium giganteum TaxID=4803 RepID=A0AAV2YTS4_9STRA|nr:TPA: hypothetical protein N0F65_009682 [Lagenidium giganteum]